MEKSFRRLLPRRSPSPITDAAAPEGLASIQQTPTGRRATKSVRAACESCRRQKCKCDGERPSCSHCLRQMIECMYTTNAGETRSSALRRRCSALEEELETLQKLVRHIRDSPPDEAERIVAHVRSGAQAVAAYHSYFAQQDGVLYASVAAEPDLEAAALQLDSASAPSPVLRNRVQLQAYPWTSIAPDDVVSNLIAQYFILERSILFPVVHYESFTNEMKNGDIASATCCSPLLVNAICAQQCFLSPGYSLGTSESRHLGQGFLDESYRLLQLRAGPVTLPIAQAVTLIYQAELAKEVFDVTSGV
ncbi:uncharacterized protein UV8b_06480 [Ustilaginoidea virens]|uniref:Zn(2)-C6 fungal-type domain-containing protein n=1 Tax=Ustilaginoidea virens TaxID=1159556 RepID=A0A8E5HVC5_USTVR|nr:uncharacterized protein UV8b_06480 [Ustilaginoidea virens]QUC22239.1 hypothetical protein UV8b_06480 [Ustilaginoidea virens]